MIKLLKNKNGITLIALVITIIVMLILVAVTISMTINGGLFGYAGNAVKDTEQAKQEELNIGKSLNVSGTMFNSIDEYVDLVKSNTPIVTDEMILGFIENNDICTNTDAITFTESLKRMGSYYESSGSSTWYDANIYRCSLNDKIYIVGTKEEGGDTEVEILDWDGVITDENNGIPEEIVLSFGTYHRGDNRYDSTAFTYQAMTSNLFLIPPFHEICLLCYTLDGWLINIQWID